MMRSIQNAAYVGVSRYGADSAAFFIYANNGSKSVLAQDRGGAKRQ